MDQNQSFNQNQFNQTPPVRTGPGGLPRWVYIAAIVVLIAALPFVINVLGGGGNKKPPASSAPRSVSSGAADALYASLANAAKQQRLRVAMYRITYANKADADSGQHPGTIASSVSEVDTVAGKYRSVYAHNLLREDGTFSIGRCLDGKTYIDIFENPPATNTVRANTLQGTAGQLKLVPEGNLALVTQPIVTTPCPHLGLVVVGGATPLPVARLSDGVFPVTLSDAQAANWAKQLKSSNLFTVRDEGRVERDGRSLHKFSFVPKEQSGVNRKLYDLFYQAGEIDKIKREHPDAEWQFEFITVNPLNTGSVGGFYLVDDQTNLPVYSELYGTNPDRPTGQTPAAGKNIARTKQTYVYPPALSIDINTPLELLQ